MIADRRRIALAGFGAIGRNHARNLASFPDVSLTVVETNAESRAEAEATGYEVADSLDVVIDRGCDAVVLAVPTALHHALALQAIRAGKAVLVEKPIARSVEEGREIIAEAKANAVPLMIGYVERYNPAVIALKKFIADGHLGRIFAISARRVGVMPARIKDANVLVDIGVHDIDAIAFLTESRLELRSALGGRARLEDRLDFATLAIDATGISAVVETNWITPVKIRELYVTGEQGICHVDYITQSAKFAAHHDVALEDTFEGTVARYRSGEWNDLTVLREEPLRCELRIFLDALNGAPLPDPELGLISLQIAEQATISIEEGLVVPS